MKRAFVFTNNGEIVGGVESNDKNLQLDPVSYVEISDYKNADEILYNSNNFKVSKDASGKLTVTKKKEKIK